VDLPFIEATLATAVRAGTPLLYAALGAILHERAGVLNLGLEGVMLAGAVTGFLTVVSTGSLGPALLSSVLVGGALGGLLGLLVVGFRVNQVVAGLALSIFGTGLSGHLGSRVIGVPAPDAFVPVKIPLLSDIPLVGPAFFNHDPLVYALYPLVPALWWLLFRTRLGLRLRATGEEPGAADALGVNVPRTRLVATVLGGMVTAVGGAYLSLAYTPTWIENMAAGRGWIALALVVFSGWNPLVAAGGAYFFGGVDSLGFRLQAVGFTAVPSFFLRMMPYVLTILLLLTVSSSKTRGVPRALGTPYYREQR
jgi:simple sugar transport system permease protein